MLQKLEVGVSTDHVAVVSKIGRVFAILLLSPLLVWYDTSKLKYI